jgi:hypothetical protein
VRTYRKIRDRRSTPAASTISLQACGPPLDGGGGGGGYRRRFDRTVPRFARTFGFARTFARFAFRNSRRLGQLFDGLVICRAGQAPLGLSMRPTLCRR